MHRWAANLRTWLSACCLLSQKHSAQQMTWLRMKWLGYRYCKSPTGCEGNNGGLLSYSEKISVILIQFPLGRFNLFLTHEALVGRFCARLYSFNAVTLQLQWDVKDAIHFHLLTLISVYHPRQTEFYRTCSTHFDKKKKFPWPNTSFKSLTLLLYDHWVELFTLQLGNKVIMR